MADTINNIADIINNMADIIDKMSNLLYKTGHTILSHILLQLLIQTEGVGGGGRRCTGLNGRSTGRLSVVMTIL